MNASELQRCTEKLESLFREQEEGEPNVHVLNAIRMHIRSAEFAAKGDQCARHFLTLVGQLAESLHTPARWPERNRVGGEQRRHIQAQVIAALGSIRECAKSAAGA